MPNRFVNSPASFDTDNKVRFSPRFGSHPRYSYSAYISITKIPKCPSQNTNDAAGGIDCHPLGGQILGER